MLPRREARPERALTECGTGLWPLAWSDTLGEGLRAIEDIGWSPPAEHSICLAINFFQSIYTRVRPQELRLQATTLPLSDGRFSAAPTKFTIV